MTSLMQGVIKRGTGRRAKELGRPAAGKTGTTNDCTDAWFIGYTPQLVASVWVGFDDIRPIGKKQTGGRVAAPIWTDFMKAALENRPVERFAVPSNIEFVEVDPDSGLLAPPESRHRLRVAYKRGTAPTKYYDPTEEERLTEEIMHVFERDLGL
jgi:penicillin-binding protein 1A